VDHVNVIWRSYHEPEIIPRGYWDQAILEEFFSHSRYDHRTSFDGVQGGAVVVLNGRTHTSDEDIHQLNEELNTLSWCLLFLTGDEEASFPWRKVQHPASPHGFRVWVMSPRRPFYDDCAHLINGYRPYTRTLLREIGEQERTLDFFFAGQVNHDRRTECESALVPLLDSHSGHFIPTDHFGDEKLSYPEYLTVLSRAKVAPCPSGNYCPDTFRVWEALEAGCIPVVDAYSTCYREPGFWSYLLPDIPFPIVNDWSEFPAVLDSLLADWTNRSNRVFSWWIEYKRELKRTIERDIAEIWRP
jgi:hypothetical protein